MEIEELTKRRERSHAAIQAANAGSLSSFSSMLGCTAMPTCDADGVQVNEEVRGAGGLVFSLTLRAARARRPGNVGQAHLGARQEEEGAQGAREFTQDPARLGIGQPGHGGVHVPDVSRPMYM